MNNRTIFMIEERETGFLQGAYSRACHTEYEFNSARSARRANVYDIYEDKTRYKINKYEVIYKLIEEDCDKEWLWKN